MLDLCIVPSDLMDEIKSLVTDSIGIAKEDILLAFVHTPMAPQMSLVFLVEQLTFRTGKNCQV